MAGITLIHKWTKNGAPNPLSMTTGKRLSVASTAGSSPSMVISGFDAESIELSECTEEASPRFKSKQKDSNNKHLKSTTNSSLGRPSGQYHRLVCASLSEKCIQEEHYRCQNGLYERSYQRQAKNCAIQDNRFSDEFGGHRSTWHSENYEVSPYNEANGFEPDRKCQNLRTNNIRNELRHESSYVKWEHSNVNNQRLQPLDCFVPYMSSMPLLHDNRCHSNCQNFNQNYEKLNCFIQTKGEDGIFREKWVCQSRKDFRLFLESPEFEADLSRNFLKLINISYYDRMAYTITYKTLKMLKACRYVSSDILQCVALALCHIRRASKRIFVRNTTEAAYFFCLQIFLAHCYILDETCPIKEWYKHLFSGWVNFDALNNAIMGLFSAEWFSLHVKSEIVHSAVHELVDL